MNYSIQILRGLAAVLVVIYHSFIKYDQYYGGDYSFQVGMVGVDIFFVISGYIMCIIYSKKSLVLIDFLIDRFRRIIPIYWILTSAAYLAYLFIPELVNSSGGYTRVLESFLLWPTSGKFLIQNGWTLSYEFYFYFIFAAASLLFGHFLYSCMIILLLPIIASLMEVDWANGFLTNDIIYEFTYGVLAFYINKQVKNNSTCLLLVTITSFLLAYLIDGRAGSFGAAAFFIVSLLSRLEISLEIVQQYKGVSILKRIGDSSYSLYLVHTFTLVIVAKIAGSIIYFNSVFLFVSLLCLVSIVVSWYFYKYVEKPLDVFLKKIIDTRYKK